jgi:hypothetical protein
VALGRTSTAAEEAYLRDGGKLFGQIVPAVDADDG